jgi:hypothetical protein
MATQTALTVREWQHDGERPPLGILIESSTSDEYWSLRAHFITFDPEDKKPRNLSSGRQPLADVFIGGQADRLPPDYVREEGDEGRIYAFALHLETAGPRALSLSELKATTKALSLIDKRMTALAERLYDEGKTEVYGWRTFREWFPVLVGACGITQGRIVTYEGEPSGWYNSSTFRELTVEQAIDLVEQSAKDAVK